MTITKTRPAPSPVETPAPATDLDRARNIDQAPKLFPSGRDRSTASGPARASTSAAMLVGAAAIVFSALYFASDLIEFGQGGFSTFQLALTYAAEAAIPLFVIGLYAVQRPRIGTLGLVGALAYAYSYVFFTSTVVYALLQGTKDWSSLNKQMGAWITVHGIVMVVAGLSFGFAVIKARVLPRWTGLALMAGVVLVAVASVLPDVAQTLSAGIRDLAFAGMGAALLASRKLRDKPHDHQRSFHSGARRLVTRWNRRA
jgi:hypothetical protein